MSLVCSFFLASMRSQSAGAITVAICFGEKTGPKHMLDINYSPAAHS